MGSDQRYEEIPYRGRAFTQTHPSRLASLAHLFGVAAADAYTSACGAFVDTGELVRFYCFDKSTSRWLDATATAFPDGSPASKVRPSLAYHALRSSSGAPLTGDVTYGQFWLALSANGNVPGMHVSTAVSRSTGPRLATSSVWTPPSSSWDGSDA